MKRLMLIPFFLIPALAMAQGYTGQHEVEQLGNGVYPSDGDLANWSSADLRAALDAYPVDETGKGFITIFTTPGCAACESLKRCLAADPNWRQAVSSGNFTVNHYSYNDPKRPADTVFVDTLRRDGLRIDSFPTLIVQSSKQTGYQVISQETGYSGNCHGIVVRTLGRIVRFVRKITPPYPNVFPRPQPNNTPVVYTPPPPEPAPSPFPVPTPGPIVQWPPVDTVEPVAMSSRPYAVLVTDPDGLEEKIKERIGRGVAKLLAARYDITTKIFQERWSDEVGQKHGITRDLTPCLILYEGEQKVGFLSSRVMAFLNDTELTVAEAETEPSVAQKATQALHAVADAVPGGWPTWLVGLIGGGALLSGGGVAGVWSWLRNRKPSAVVARIKARAAKALEAADEAAKALEELK